MTPELVQAVVRMRKREMISTAAVGTILFHKDSARYFVKWRNELDILGQVELLDEQGNNWVVDTDQLNLPTNIPVSTRYKLDAQLERFKPLDKGIPSTSDGSTADYYQLPKGATQLQDLISQRNMNAQLGEIFRAAYRYGQASHSDQLRDAKKIKFYIEAEIARLENLPK